MKVLVATRNRDKFEVVRQMVEQVISDATLISLSQANVSGDVLEVGTVPQRARQKAEYFVERLGRSERTDEFDAVLAVDDGIRIAEGDVTPHSQEITDRILNGDWPPGTVITVVRAFGLRLLQFLSYILGTIMALGERQVSIH
jgi:hypothetical protein